MILKKGTLLKCISVLTTELYFCFSSKDDLKIIINGTNISKKPCHIWTETLDRKDNFFIVRYKLYDTCSKFEISGKYKNIGLGKILHTNVLPDDCMCPSSDLNNFIESWKCGPTPNLVKKQLKEFGKINWDEKRQDVSKLVYDLQKLFYSKNKTKC